MDIQVLLNKLTTNSTRPSRLIVRYGRKAKHIFGLILNKFWKERIYFLQSSFIFVFE